MSAIETGNLRTTNSRLAYRRRVTELMTLAGASLALLFVLAVAFGLISG